MNSNKIHEGYISGKLTEIEHPPLGLMPKKLFYEKIQQERFEQLCRVLAKHFNSSKKIKVEWIEEYNELIENVNKKENENDDN
jgi:hypothetical protein